jgi:hypothetical protein
MLTEKGDRNEAIQTKDEEQRRKRNRLESKRQKEDQLQNISSCYTDLLHSASLLPLNLCPLYTCSWRQQKQTRKMKKKQSSETKCTTD